MAPLASVAFLFLGTLCMERPQKSHIHGHPPHPTSCDHGSFPFVHSIYFALHLLNPRTCYVMNSLIPSSYSLGCSVTLALARSLLLSPLGRPNPLAQSPSLRPPPRVPSWRALRVCGRRAPSPSLLASFLLSRCPCLFLPSFLPGQETLLPLLLPIAHLAAAAAISRFAWCDCRHR